jgi:hypothetical protein
MRQVQVEDIKGRLYEIQGSYNPNNGDDQISASSDPTATISRQLALGASESVIFLQSLDAVHLSHKTPSVTVKVRIHLIRDDSPHIVDFLVNCIRLPDPVQVTSDHRAWP